MKRLWTARAAAAFLLCGLTIGALHATSAPQAGDTSITYEPKPGAGKGKHVVFLAGDEEYRSEEALPMLAKILSQRHGFKATVLFSVAADGTISSGNTVTVTLAVSEVDAQAIIYAREYAQLWFTKQNEETTPSTNTPFTLQELLT